MEERRGLRRVDLFIVGYLLYNVRIIKQIFNSKCTAWAAACAVISVSCSTSNEPGIEHFGYDHYPLQIGLYRHYEVREILFNQNAADTSYYQLREIDTDSFPGAGGQLSYTLSRYKRLDANDTWELDSIWSTYTNPRQAVLNKNGLPVLIMVFPFSENLIWDSNALNAKNTDEYKLQAPFQPYELSGIQYGNTTIVVQEENLDSLIFLDHRFEVYAKDIGLIDKLDNRLVFCQDQGCLGQKIVDEGRIYRQTLIEYGVE